VPVADSAKPEWWVVLSNTTLGVLMATLNASILLIALPDGPGASRGEQYQPVQRATERPAYPCRYPLTAGPAART